MEQPKRHPCRPVRTSRFSISMPGVILIFRALLCPSAVYTTNGEAYTFVPSTPSTPTPSIRSFGSIQNLQDCEFGGERRKEAQLSLAFLFSPSCSRADGLSLSHPTDMASRSNRGVAGSAPPVTATAVIGGGGTNKNNIVQANSGPCTRVRAPWRMVEIPVVFAGTLRAIQVVL